MTMVLHNNNERMGYFVVYMINIKNILNNYDTTWSHPKDNRA